jgi:hypothetical protein
MGLELVEIMPLMETALKGWHLNVLRCLINDLHADVNQADSYGVTAMFAAAQENNTDAIRCLLELRGDINQAHITRETPLHAAATNAHLNAVKCLIELNADVNQAHDEGATPLHEAAKYGSLEVVRCLVNSRANVDQADNEEQTPLMMASYLKHTDVVNWLVKAGADVRTTSIYGCTAAKASKDGNAPAEQTAYLEAKMRCSHLGCSGAGIQRCTGCKQARYCGEPCQLAHWKAHKADCKRVSATLKATVAQAWVAPAASAAGQADRLPAEREA